MSPAEKILLEIYGCKTIKELQDYLGLDVSIAMITEAMEKYFIYAKDNPPQITIWTPEWKSDYA